MIVWKPRTAFTAAVPRPAASGSAIASKRLIPSASACVTSRCSDVSPIPRRGRFAMRSKRDGVVRVVDDGEVRHRVLDLGALVEARAADHLVGHLLPHEHVLEHAALRVRAVEDRDLGRRPAALDEPRDLRRDEPRLGVLVLDLDDLHRLALAEVGEEPLRLAVAVVLDHGVRGAEDRVRRAVVLLERDRLGAGEVALEVEDVVDVGAAEAVDRVVRDDAVGDEVVRALDVEVVDRAVELDALDAIRRCRRRRPRRT